MIYLLLLNNNDVRWTFDFWSWYVFDCNLIKTAIDNGFRDVLRSSTSKEFARRKRARLRSGISVKPAFGTYGRI